MKKIIKYFDKNFFSQSIYFEFKNVKTDFVNQSIKGMTMGPLILLRYMPLI